MTPPPVEILWTSGWDSTYRVLHLVFDRHVLVQPWYLNDSGRASTPYELAAMEAIRRAVADRDEEVAARILPTQVLNVCDVAPNERITASYRRRKLGPQYDWLARFAEQANLCGLEIGTTKDGRIHKILEHDLERVEGRGGPTYRLIEHPSDPDLLLFRRFEFPLFEVTKKDMARNAQQKGYADIMRQTWFCHEPRAGKPCGMCIPCMITLEEGLGWRIPSHHSEGCDPVCASSRGKYSNKPTPTAGPPEGGLGRGPLESDSTCTLFSVGDGTTESQRRVC